MLQVSVGKAPVTASLGQWNIAASWGSEMSLVTAAWDPEPLKNSFVDHNI